MCSLYVSKTCFCFHFTLNVLKSRPHSEKKHSHAQRTRNALHFRLQVFNSFSEIRSSPSGWVELYVYKFVERFSFLLYAQLYTIPTHTIWSAYRFSGVKVHDISSKLYEQCQYILNLHWVNMMERNSFDTIQIFI